MSKRLNRDRRDDDEDDGASRDKMSKANKGDDVAHHHERSVEGSLFRVPPHCYLHVLDQTTNVTRVETGPLTFIRKDNERVLMPPTKMVIVPPRHYCVVRNPVLRDEDVGGDVVLDGLGQAKLAHAETEVRLERDPFPLYPGEEIETKVQPLTVVAALTALRLRVTRDFADGTLPRVAGDEYLFEGPGTYIPRKEVEVVATERAVVIRPNEALKLRAARDTVDRDGGKKRVAGEEWLVRRPGAYLAGAYEVVVETCFATILTDKTAVHVRAMRSFTDQTGTKRKNGEEYLITSDDLESFIPDVYERIVGMVDITTLTVRQYCVVLNPLGDDGKPMLGHRRMVKGEKSFFLRPGEELEDSCVKEVFVLGEDEGIVLRSVEAYKDEQMDPAVDRLPGDRWMMKGPMEYIPPVQVEVVATRKAIPLHENEGVYIRNTRSGAVRAEIGKSYMLGEDEELWAKALSPMVRTLLSKNRDPCADRGEWINPEKEKRKDKASSEQQQQLQEQGGGGGSADMDPTRVITFQVPHNAAVQIYDYRSKKSRVVFGPDLVLLGPNEEFTQLSLSGGKPKKPNLIRAIALLLGPDFCSDLIVVETSDHARLQLQLSYNWHFDLSKCVEGDDKDRESGKIFCVLDFTGDMCKAIASRIRGAVSSVSFDDFHKNSARIIKVAVFGVDEAGRKPCESLRFEANNLVVTSIDIRSVEPVDQRTRDSLQKSVTLAIEITTQSQEATAKREAERVDQEARGRLDRQRINDDAEAEKARRELLTLQAESAAVEATGQAKAEALSRAEAARIEAEAAVHAAKLKVEATNIEAEAELERLRAAREAEVQFMTEQNRLEVEKADLMAKIETGRFEQMVEALGADTLRSMASGPQDHQVRMLQSLGLTSTLITDGRTPVNLLNTAQGLLGMMGDKQQH